MRGSVHFMPRETAPAIVAATARRDAKLFDLRLKIARTTPEQYARFKQTILKSVHEPVTVRALRKMTGDSNSAFGTLLRAMSEEGLVLRVGAPGLRSNDLNYAPVKAWLGEPLPKADRSESVRWLTREYLRAFGPIRVRDLMWWTGTTKSVAAEALSQVETVDVGEGYLVLKEHLRAFEKAKPFARDVIDILPKWDCYTMGYAPDGRARFVAPDLQTRIYDLAGDGYGAILLDGLAIAAWDLRGKSDTLDIHIDWFEKPGAKIKQAVCERFDSVGAFLESRNVTFKHLGDEHPQRAVGRLR
jgi:hypothetical protein